ncbi:hypothetical protein LXA43DRAFT_1083453 [Ganoderma leucocontextum]|nr:hypothetical protein LXA43DRAFT_1083453 [Ganoderma leucocontextum]
MPNSEDEEPPAEVDPAYLAFFSESVDDFRAHLSGRDGDEPPPASYFAPRSHWTSAEKDAFFRGLAVHSRLRPDLIAEEVKTKTVPDVCVYLAILEEAERELTQGTTYIDEPNCSFGAKYPRRELPSALEVSEEWVALEERMAVAMIALQPTLDRQAVIRARKEEVQARRVAIRVVKGSARATSKQRKRDEEKLRREEFDKWVAEKTQDWESEDLLLSLGRIRLTTLDRMLRDDEEGHGEADEVGGYNSEEESAPLQETEGMEPANEHHSGVAQTLGIDDQFIDPVLLAISQPSFSSAAVGEPGPSRSAAGSSSVLEPSSPISQPAVHSTPPVLFHSLPASPQLSFHTTAATVAVPSVRSNEGSIGDLSQMSPGARRRYQKRLYMRKKRAQATGGVLVEAVERLKPGRKSRKAASVDDSRAQATTDAPSSPSTPGDALLPAGPSAPQAGHQTAENARKSTDDKPRMKLPSKGIDIQRLRREGFDLFHLQAMSKLMQTYNSLHDVPESVGSAISGATLSTLHALVVTFVAEVMSRAIVWREQERVAKLQTKAWRLRENQVISAANVKQALMLYGAESLDKRAHFARLLSKLGLDEGEGEVDVIDEERHDIPVAPPAASGHHTGDTEEGLEEGPEEDADEADRPPLEPLSLLRTIFPPFSNPLSGASKDASMAVDASVYMPCPPSTRIPGDARPPPDEDVLPETFDEKLLLDELLEERQLEKYDRHRDIDGERALWTRVNAKNPHPNLAADTVDSELEDLAADDEKRKEFVIRERPPRKRKRQAVDTVTEQDVEPDASRGKDAEGGNAGERNGADTPMDVDEPEAIAPKRRRMARGGKLSQKQLLYMEPGANSRIKSSVYVLDSD